MPNDQSKCVSIEQDHVDGKTYLSLGSLFASPDLGIGNVNINIPIGVSLTISCATYRGPHGSIAELWIDTDATGLVPLCNAKASETLSGLGLSLVGPQLIRLGATTSTSSTSSSPVKNVSVLGSISPVDYVYEKTIVARENVGADTKSKKRRLSNADDSSNDAPPTNVNKNDGNAISQNEQDEGEPTQQTLSKRQRKKLAKKKAKELAAAVSFLNKHEAQVDSSKNDTKSEKQTSVTSVTKERRLPSGVYVKDIIVGNGAPVKLGRKVSILYEGAFPNGKVFDKSKNKNNPFTFRQGTGEVIKGLEKGLEGMRVGGEREITIPPEQGYGRKTGSGPVPPNSTLVFSVQLVGLGG